LLLSERRAKSVMKYFNGKGIATERMTVVFYGEGKPAETNGSKEGRRKNRRVEFKILKL
jgi:outer membrane protein OmpA-like peptidoglycan-associated protein